MHFSVRITVLWHDLGGDRRETMPGAHEAEVSAHGIASTRSISIQVSIQGFTLQLLLAYPSALLQAQHHHLL